MSKFTENMKVIVIGENNEIKKGTIKEVYEELGYAIVEMPNGELEKVELKNLGILPETEAVNDENQNKQPNKPEFLPEITITHDEFRQRSLDVIRPTNVRELLKDKMGEIENPMITVDIALMGALVIAWLEDELFKVKSENE